MNLFDYTYCGNYNRQIQNLSRIVPEKWSFGGTEDNGILKGYLEHTFQRVYEEGKILETENYAIFNTGLFNRYYQPVYVYFIPNQVPDRQRWFLEGFYTEYYLLKSGIDSLPKRAEYVQDPSELIFDTGLDIIPQYEHIFEETENNQRLPENIRNSVMKVPLFDGALRSVCRIRQEQIWHLPASRQKMAKNISDGPVSPLRWRITMRDCWPRFTAAGCVRNSNIPEGMKNSCILYLNQK